MKIIQTKNKRGISEIVSYVLLVVLAISLASATYIWLQSYAKNPLPEESCPEGVSVIVTNYSCYEPVKGDGELNLTIKNNGRFNINGIIISYINNSNTNFEYRLEEVKSPGYDLNVTNETNISFLDYNPPLKRIILYPYITDKRGFNSLCEKAVARIEISACDSPEDNANY